MFQRRIWVASGILSLVLGAGAVACGSAPAEIPPLPEAGTRPLDPPPVPVPDAATADDAGPAVLPPVDPPPPAKQDEVTEAFGVFVSASAEPAGEGTRAKPFSTIAEGLEKAAAAKKKVFVCAGTYAEALVLHDGVSIVANLDCSDPTKWKVGGAHALLSAPTSPAVRADDIASATRVEGLDVAAPAGTEDAPNSVALFATGSPGLTFSDGKLEAGNAAAGARGADPAAAVAMFSPPASSVLPARCKRLFQPEMDCSPTNYNNFPGGAGGTNECRDGAGAVIGVSRGGYGGSSNVFIDGFLNASTIGGADGTAGGADGVVGASSTGGAFSDTGFAPGDGAAGTNGGMGAGGKGGNPHVLGEPTPPTPAGVRVMWGWGQGGGGAGGCPGLAGTPGRGGGASVGAYLVRSRVRFERVAIRSGDGGAGGRGSFGSLPTGPQQPVEYPGTVAFPGAQAGLPGRFAGSSGSGAGGASVAIVSSQNGNPVVVDSTLAHGAAGAGVPEAREGGSTIAAAPAGLAADTRTY